MTVLNIIFNDVECNMYHDSYFYYIYYNRVTKQILKHEHSATAYASYQPLKDSVKLQDLPEKEQKELKQEIEMALETTALELIMENNIIDEWDTVKVSNPRARNFKGVEFVARHIKELIWNRRTTGWEATNEDRTIKTNLSNLTIVKPHQRSIDNVIWQLRSGKLIKKY